MRSGCLHGVGRCRCYLDAPVLTRLSKKGEEGSVSLPDSRRHEERDVPKGTPTFLFELSPTKAASSPFCALTSLCHAISVSESAIAI